MGLILRRESNTNCLEYSALMDLIRVCATDLGQFFTSKNLQQTSNFEVLLQIRTGSFLDNIIVNTRSVIGHTLKEDPPLRFR